MEKFKCVRDGFVVIAFDFSLHILILPSVVHLECVRTGSQQRYTSVLKSLKDIRSSFNNDHTSGPKLTRELQFEFDNHRGANNVVTAHRQKEGPQSQESTVMVVALRGCSLARWCFELNANVTTLPCSQCHTKMLMLHSYHIKVNLIMSLQLVSCVHINF